jgi:hypothetical protein
MAQDFNERAGLLLVPAAESALCFPDLRMPLVPAPPITPDAASAPTPTPAQQRFQALVRKIEQARARLAAWRDALQAAELAQARTVGPLIREVRAAQKDWIVALDRVIAQPTWTRSERAALRERLCDGANAFLEHGSDDAAVKALHDKHAEVDFDTSRQRMQEALAAMREHLAAFGNLDPEAGPWGAGREPRHQPPGDGAEDADDADRRDADADRNADAVRRHTRRQRGAAAKPPRESDERPADRSVRDVFRQLASALHPDREPDPSRRQVKTALMQEVNQAYAANDLLALFELQARIAPVAAADIAESDPQRLKQFNRVLAEQLARIDEEAARIEVGFRNDFGLVPGTGMKPKSIDRMIKAQARHLRAMLTLHQREVRVLDDRVATRRWLRQGLVRPGDDPEF